MAPIAAFVSAYAVNNARFASGKMWVASCRNRCRPSAAYVGRRAARPRCHCDLQLLQQVQCPFGGIVPDYAEFRAVARAQVTLNRPQDIGVVIHTQKDGFSHVRSGFAAENVLNYSTDTASRMTHLIVSRYRCWDYRGWMIEQRLGCRAARGEEWVWPVIFMPNAYYTARPQPFGWNGIPGRPSLAGSGVSTSRFTTIGSCPLRTTTASQISSGLALIS